MAPRVHSVYCPPACWCRLSCHARRLLSPMTAYKILGRFSYVRCITRRQDSLRLDWTAIVDIHQRRLTTTLAPTTSYATLCSAQTHSQLSPTVAENYTSKQGSLKWHDIIARQPLIAKTDFRFPAAVLIAGEDDVMSMTRSLNVTPKTTEQRI